MNSNSPSLSSGLRNPTLWLLVIGIIVRLLAINHPLVDAHLYRQTQTALMTRQMIEEPGLHLGGIATWRGDLPARLIQEFPVFNYLIMPVYKITGNLDMSGKLVSVLLWIACFFLLQCIWRRCLTESQRLWANVLFVVAPLSVFFGQAFMPEMVVQLLAFSFLVALFRYDEKPRTMRLVIAMIIGTLGMVVKTPEILHLYVLLVILVLKREGLRALKVPAYWVVGIISIIIVQQWGRVMETSNVKYFPEWTASSYLAHFIGNIWQHFAPMGYIRILLYLTCFTLGPLGLVCVAIGIWRLFRSRPWGPAVWWVLSIAFFYFFWSGPVGRGQSYYNLPALGPCALLFALGADWLWRLRVSSNLLRRCGAGMLIAGLAVFWTVGNLYLFQPDQVILECTRWIRENTQPDDLILLKANHREDSVEYQALAPYPYYARRRFWVYSHRTLDDEKERALATSRYALVTLPPQTVSARTAWRRRLKGEAFAVEDITPELSQAGFRPIYTNINFVVYGRP
jgi:4-amino-4-deoxy-L-arabinose transferase-like glycosyltransferase